MEKIFVLKNIPVAFIVLASATSSGFAISKLFDNPSPNNNSVVEVKQSDTEDASVKGASTESENTTESSDTRKTNPISDTSSVCVVTLFGKKYDVTSLKSTHSGGDIFTCNTDMTTIYQSQHGSDLTRMSKYLVTSTGKAATVSKSSGANVPKNVFTAETLALHNKPGDSYIAYNGIVYDVSHHPSWATGVHHGMPAGVDITSRFPHPVSYLSTLPVVGTYVGGSSTASGSGNTSVSDDGQDEDKKYEVEDKEEDTSEIVGH